MAKNDTTDRQPTVDFSAISSSFRPTSQEAEPASTIPGVQRNSRGYFDIPLKLIEEDPNQPRLATNFNEESIKEMAETIEADGLMQPISVRKHPNKPDMFMVNYGARRLRASRLLGKKTIGAIITEDFSIDKQVIENLHREDLDNKSLLSFMSACMARGMKRKEIATRLKKPEKWVTMYTQLLDARNDGIRDAFEAGKIASVAVAYELAAMAKKDEDANAAIVQLLADGGEITNATVKRLKDRTKNPNATEDTGETSGKPQAEGVATIPHTTAEVHEDGEQSGNGSTVTAAKAEHEPDTEDVTSNMPEVGERESPSRPAKVFIFATYKDEPVTIIPKEPSGKTKAIIKTANGEEKEVPIKSLTLLRVWKE